MPMAAKIKLNQLHQA